MIRLEERLRLERLLPADLRGRIPELTTAQLVALRFASDGELAELVRAVFAEKLVDRRAIKQRIRRHRVVKDDTWRDKLRKRSELLTWVGTIGREHGPGGFLRADRFLHRLLIEQSRRCVILASTM